MGSAPSKAPTAQAKITAVSRIAVTPKPDKEPLLPQIGGSKTNADPKPPNQNAVKPGGAADKPASGQQSSNSTKQPTSVPIQPPSVPTKPPSVPTQPLSVPTQPPSVPTQPIKKHVPTAEEKEQAAELAHQKYLNSYKTKIALYMAKYKTNPSDIQTQCFIINSTNTVFFEMRGYPSWISKHRDGVCDFIHATGGVTEAICDSIMGQAKSANITSSVSTAGLLVIVNLSDHSSELSQDICATSGFLQFLYDTCDQYKDSYSAGLYDPQQAQVKQLMIRILMILHNLAMRHTNVPALQELKFVPVLHHYLEYPNDTIKMTAILAMADIMTEDESNLINANTTVIKFLLRTFGRSVNASNHQATDGSGMIWSSLELAKGIGSMATNDGNKKLLVDQGCLPPLLRLANSEDPEEQNESLKSLWALSFNESNQDSMIAEPGLIKFIDEHNRTGSSEVRSTCYGILWTMRNKLMNSQEYKSIGQRLLVKRAGTASRKRTKTIISSPSKGGFTEKADLEISEKEQIEEEVEEKGHVMISYQWGNQKLLTQIRDRIRASNQKVWMDIDDMEGSTLQAMAEAIENAEVVLICMSRKYKESPNCRAEAEYAHQLRKKVIPLIMENGYRPDGWLGMILGAKLFYDFSGKYPFESKIEGLLKEVCMKVKGIEKSGNTGNTVGAGPPAFDEIDGPVEEKIVPVKQAPLFAPSRPPPQKIGSVKKWSKNQVKDWLTKHQLSGPAITKLTGKEIAFLQKIQIIAPDFYYQTLKDDLVVKSLTDLANFEAAMDDLPET